MKWKRETCVLAGFVIGVVITVLVMLLFARVFVVLILASVIGVAVFLWRNPEVGRAVLQALRKSDKPE